MTLAFPPIVVDPIVLVVNWSTPDDLDNCLASLREHEDLPVSVLQNYHSREVTEQTYDIAHQHGARFVHHLENLGHGAGINRLAQMAKNHSHFFIVNPDVEWREPVVDRLIDFLEEDPNRCIVGPKQLDSRGRVTAGGIFGTFAEPQHRDFRRPDPANKLHRDTRQAIVVSGAAMMIRSTDFFEYGGLLESHHYYSETWLCYHSAAHGRTNWYYGEPWMIHEWHTSTPIGHPLSDGKGPEDQKLFRKMCDQHNPPIPHN